MEVKNQGSRGSELSAFSSLLVARSQSLAARCVVDLNLVTGTNKLTADG